jgi:hypothetical protein
LALLDEGGYGAGAPAEPNNPPLPAAPIGLPSLGGLFNGFQQAFGGAQQFATPLFSQALFNQSPQQVGQDFSNLGSDVQSNLSAFSNDFESFMRQSGGPGNLAKVAGENLLMGPLTAFDPNNSIPLAASQQAGKTLGPALQGLEKATAPPQGGYNPIIEPLESTIHSVSILGQAGTNLMTDSKSIDQQLVDSFKEGIGSTLDGPDAEARNQDAVQKLLGGMGQISDDIFNDQLINRSLKDSLIGSGASISDAQKAADYVSGPLSIIASFLVPGGVGKLMLAQFVGQLMSDPGKAIHSFIDTNPSNPGEQPTTGDFTHLFQKTWAWMQGQADAPTPQEVNSGLSALSYDVGLGFLGLHAARESAGTAIENKQAFERGLQGEDPSGAKDVISGTENLQQAYQASPAGETGQTSQGIEAGPSGAPEATSEAGQAGANIPSTIAAARTQGQGVPAANAESLSPGAGSLRPQQTGNYTVSGGGVNEDGAKILDLAGKKLDEVNGDGVVTNIHAVTDQTRLANEAGVMGVFDPAYGRTIAVDVQNAYKRPLYDIDSFLQKAQQFVQDHNQEDIKPEYQQAITNGLNTVHNFLFNYSAQDNLDHVVAHEAYHASTWARVLQSVPEDVAQVLSNQWMPIGKFAMGLFSSLKENGAGQRWLTHPSTEAAIGGDLKAIEKLITTGEVPDLIDDFHDPFTHLVEHFNSQLTWDEGQAPHPYSLQAGDHAYTETFYNTERAVEAAQLAGQWYNATADRAASAIQRDPNLSSHTSSGSLYRRTPDRSTDATPENQGGLDWLHQTLDQLYDRADRLGVVDDIKRLAAERKTAGQIAKELNLSTTPTPENPFSTRDAESMVRAVRSRLGIPSMDDKEEFQKWIDQQKAQQPEPLNFTELHAALGRLSDAIDKYADFSGKKTDSPSLDELEKEYKSVMGEDPPQGLKTEQDFQGALATLRSTRSNMRAEAEKAGVTPEGDVTLGELKDQFRQVMGKDPGQEDATPEPGVRPEPAKPAGVDYRQMAGELSQAKPTDKLAALRPVASLLKLSFDNLDRAIASGAPGELLQRYATDLNFNLAKFKASYDLYTSAVGQKILDKQDSTFKQTRAIARQIDQATASPNEKAQMAALKLGMSLEQARNVMRDSALGLNNIAKNWHDDYKSLLMGELGRLAKEVKTKDANPPLGVENIPVHELLETLSTQDLKDARVAAKKDFIAKRDALQVELQKAKLAANARRPGSAQNVKDLTSSLKQLFTAQAANDLRLQARIRNHPDTHQSGIANQPPMLAEDLEMAKNPDPVKHAATMPDHPHEHTPTQDMVEEAAGMNGKLASPVPNPFSLESLIDEEKGAEARQGAETPARRNPGEGLQVFGPDYGQHLSTLRQQGGNYYRAANLIHDMLVNVASHFDPAESMYHPAQQFNAFWQRASVEIPKRVTDISKVLDSIINTESKKNGETPEDFSRRVLRPIDNMDEAEKLRHLSELQPNESAIANFLNHYWTTTRKLLADPEVGKPVLEHYVDNYVPHIVLEDPDGNALRNKRGVMSVSRHTEFARERLTAGAEGGDPLFKTMDALTAAGYKVEENLAEIFKQHALSTMKALQIRQMFSTLQGHIYKSPDGSFVGPPVIHFSQFSDARAMQEKAAKAGIPGGFKGLEDMRHVRLGTGERIFDQYYTHPELATEVEKLSKIDKWADIGKSSATVMRALGGIFKTFQFSFNPSHAFRVYSNVATLGSKLGILSPFVPHMIYGRANRALIPEDRSYLKRATNAITGREDKYINTIAGYEKAISDAKNRIEGLKANPDEPFDPDHPNAAKLQPIWDEMNNTVSQMEAEKARYEDKLHIRDKRLAGELMGKGLTPPSELIDTADLGWLTHWQEKLPAWVPIFGSPLKQFHKWMWKDVVWNGQLGIAMHLTDQFIKGYARDEKGWDGKGGAATAETLLTPQERDAAMRRATYYAKTATGLLAKQDMSLAWQAYGRGVLLSAPWTLSQARVARDVIGNTKITRKLGRPDLSAVSDDMIKSGFGEKQAQYFDSLHTKVARRMLFGGVMKMAMTSMLLGTAMSQILTGQPSNPIQNFQRDPLHTFDTWAGKDPATGKDIWLTSGFYGFQREMAEYALAGIKAYEQGKDPWAVAQAPLVRMAGKNNPLARLAIEEVTGQEIGKWLYGFTDSSMGGDTDLQALHQALTARGFPDAGSTEDKILYGLRTLAPSPGLPTSIPVKRDQNLKIVYDKNGKPIPLYTDLGTILGQAFNVGQFGDPMKAAAYVAGAQVDTSNSLSTTLAGQGIQAQRAENEADYLLRGQLMADIVNSANQGDWEKVGQLRDQNGLTDGQVKEAILYGNSYNVNGRTITTKGLVNSGGKSNKAPITVGDHELSPDEQAQYESIRGNRELYVIAKLKDDPTFKNASNVEKASMITQYTDLADKFTNSQADQQYNNTGGATITDDKFKQVVDQALGARNVIRDVLYNDSDYQDATQLEKQKMVASYSQMANTLAWDQTFGNLKGVSPDNLQQIVGTSVQAEQMTKDYLGSTPFYQAATVADQQRMVKEYSDLSRKMALDIYTGKQRGINPVALPEYMRATVNTEETAKYLLHQSDFYQSAPLTTQQSLDNKYASLARTSTNTDWRTGNAIMNLSQSNQAYEVGSERVVVGHLLADQAFTDLQKQYGGPQKIKAYADGLSQIKSDIKQNVDAPPKTLNYLQRAAENQFLQQNPEYAAYLKARTNWERTSDLGRLYASLNANETALASADTSQITDQAGIDVSLPDQAANTIDQIVQPQQDSALGVPLVSSISDISGFPDQVGL